MLEMIITEAMITEMTGTSVEELCAWLDSLGVAHTDASCEGVLAYDEFDSQWWFSCSWRRDGGFDGFVEDLTAED